jgi:hypothetical protein
LGSRSISRGERLKQKGPTFIVRGKQTTLISLCDIAILSRLKEFGLQKEIQYPC